MNAVSSDEEGEGTNSNKGLKFKLSNKLARRLRSRESKKSKSNSIEMQHLRKRTKKILSKFKREAMLWEGYNKSSKNFIEVHQLMLEKKVKLIINFI